MFDCTKSHSIILRGAFQCALLLLLLIATGVHAGPVFKCVDAQGTIAFQANPCAARAIQTEMDIGEQPLIDPGAPTFAGGRRSPDRIRAAHPHVSHMVRSLSRHQQRPKPQPISWECRAADGEVFYRHARCPHSVAGDGEMRSGENTVVSRRGRGKRSRLPNAWDSLPVSARKVSRAQACKQINAVAAVERDGSARDESASVYEHDVGRDPCSGY